MSAANPLPLGAPRLATPGCAEARSRELDQIIDALDDLRVVIKAHKARVREREERFRKVHETLHARAERLLALADGAPCGLPRCAGCGKGVQRG